MKQDLAVEKSSFQKFLKTLQNSDAGFDRRFEESLNQQGLHVDLKKITQNLVRNNLERFASVIAGPRRLNERKIERIYSKNEIKTLVCENLIGEYRHDIIVNAVTDYLYSVHVGG